MSKKLERRVESNRLRTKMALEVAREALRIATDALAAVKGMERSTHSVQYMPIEYDDVPGVPGVPDAGSVRDDRAKKIIAGFFDGIEDQYDPLNDNDL